MSIKPTSLLLFNAFHMSYFNLFHKRLRLPRLFALLFLWLREWPNVKGRHVARLCDGASLRVQELYVSYALNLLGAASWCATGCEGHASHASHSALRRVACASLLTCF